MPALPANPPNPVVLLVDNGSLEPAATLGLRALASRLTAVTGREIHPVSLLHSSAIAPTLLHGTPAVILEPALRQLFESGVEDIILLPLFLGPSAALTDYIPERVRHLRQSRPTLRVRLAGCLVDSNRPADQRIAAMLSEAVRKVAVEKKFVHPAVAVVDHGTPQRAVNAVRELVATQTRVLLGDFARKVAASSMERRPGVEFDFNEPLLETLLEQKEFSSSKVIGAQLFLLPGRHAGPGGDVEKICRAAEARHPGLNIALTEPLGSHPGLLPILTERMTEALSGQPLH